MNPLRILVLGTKEYPRGSLTERDDPSPSGGMELYVDQLLQAFAKDQQFQFTVLTRKSHALPAGEQHGNVSVIRVPFSTGFYARNLSFNINAVRKARSLDFDLLFTHGEVANFFGLLLSRIKKKPIVMVCHGRAAKQPQYPYAVRLLLGLVDHLTYPRATAVTHAPEQLKEVTDHFSTIRPGFVPRRASASKIAAVRKEFAQQNTKTILFVGRLIDVKGLETLLRALPHVRAKVRCVVIGDGPKRAAYETLAQRLQAPVVFAGYRTDIPELLANADVFVMPSFSESLNYAMLEAADAGVPIVASDIGILPADAGLLFSPGDALGLAHAIDRMVTDRALQIRSRKNAQQFVRSFSWKQAAADFRSLFLQAAGG